MMISPSTIPAWAAFPRGTTCVRQPARRRGRRWPWPGPWRRGRRPTEVAISERPPYSLGSLECGFPQDFRMLGLLFQVIQFLLIRPGPADLEQLREQCSSAGCVPRDRLIPPNSRQASGQFLVDFSHRHLVGQDRQCQSLKRDAQVRSGSVSSNHYPAGHHLCRLPPLPLLEPTG